MAHSKSKEATSPPPPPPENFFEDQVFSQSRSLDVVSDIISDLISSAISVSWSNRLAGDRLSFAARSLTAQFRQHVAWCFIPADPDEFDAEPDDDVDIPPIDEWAVGVLPVRDAEATGLRTPFDPTPPPQPSTRRRRKQQVQHSAALVASIADFSEVKPPQSEKTGAGRTQRKPGNTRRRAKAPPTAADTILRTFDEVRKRTNVSTKAVTVDADFTVIQINEPHGLPPSLIVPRIQTKKASQQTQIGEKNTLTLSARTGRTQRATIKKPEVSKKRAPPKIVDADLPIFDNEVSDITFADRIVLSPGVTFKEGNATKSRPPLVDANQITREQYQKYLDEMMKAAE